MCPNDCLPNVNSCVLELPRSSLFLQPPPLPLLPFFGCDMLSIFSAELKGHIIGGLASYLFFFFNKQENKSGHLSPHQDRKLPFPYHYKTSPAFLEVLEACVLLVEAETKNRKNVEEKGRVYERSLVEVHWDSV